MEIKCEFGEITWNHIAPKLAYTCAVYGPFEITSRTSDIAAFNGEHLASKDNNSVEALGFFGPACKIHYIPKNLTKIFPNLVFLEFNECELKEVSVDDLVELKKLKVFWAPHNKITTLPFNLFTNMPELKRVSFKNNLIQNFQLKVLEPVKDTIEHFEILDNPGVNESFERKDGKIDNLTERLASEINEENGKKFNVLLKRFENLFVSSKHSDFTIEVRDQEYRVHKCILASQSSVFDKMFSEDEEKATKTFNKIKNFSQEAFADFLRYFYTKNIPSQERAVDLLELAVEFDVPDLKLDCETTISQTIRLDNARQIFNLAVHHSLPELKRTAFDIIKKYHPEVAEFLFQKPKLVNEILDAKDEFQAELREEAPAVENNELEVKQEVKEEKCGAIRKSVL